jgi:RHS repeat-associated protein
MTERTAVVTPTDVRYGFNGMEKDEEFSEASAIYTTTFRQYNSTLGKWFSIDPRSSDFPWQTPYCGLDNNPIYLIDSKGDSTFVKDLGSGKYQVVGGNIAGDHNGIFIRNDDGGLGEMIGYSLAPESFYNPEDQEWMGIIDKNDDSGRNFLNQNTQNLPQVITYIFNAGNNEKFDFKSTNGTDKVKFTSHQDYYRGMPIMGKVNDQTVFASARDVGNILAGYVAGADGQTPLFTRIGFDLYQSYRAGVITAEHRSTQAPQAIGYAIGRLVLYNQVISIYGGLPSYPEGQPIKPPSAVIAKNNKLKYFID